MRISGMVVIFKALRPRNGDGDGGGGNYGGIFYPGLGPACSSRKEKRSEVGGVSPTGKSFRVVRACVRAV